MIHGGEEDREKSPPKRSLAARYNHQMHDGESAKSSARELVGGGRASSPGREAKSFPRDSQGLSSPVKKSASSEGQRRPPACLTLKLLSIHTVAASTRLSLPFCSTSFCETRRPFAAHTIVFARPARSQTGKLATARGLVQKEAVFAGPGGIRRLAPRIVSRREWCRSPRESHQCTDTRSLSLPDLKRCTLKVIEESTRALE